MILGPVIPHEQHRASQQSAFTHGQRGGDSRRSNGRVLTHTGGPRHPSSGFASSRPAGARSAAGLKGQIREVLTRRPLPEPSLPNRHGTSH
jgi:hypothetical protein